MNDPNSMRIRIPFAGFYCSAHDICFDQNLEDINDGHTRITIDNVDWQEVRLNYAQAFTKKLSSAIGLEMKYYEMHSPAFYNYETDRIFAKIDRAALKACFDAIMADADASSGLKDHITEALKERPGFIPYYSNDLSDWGPIEDWDEAMMSVLVSYEFERCDVDEYHIAEDLSEKAHDLIWDHIRNPTIVPGHVLGPPDIDSNIEPGM